MTDSFYQLTIEQRLRRILTALDDLGVRRDDYVLGIVGKHVEPAGEDGYTEYETHVGATWGRDQASMLKYVADAISLEAKRQINSTFDNHRCPNCDSLRRYSDQRRDWKSEDFIRIERYDACLDCDWEEIHA